MKNGNVITALALLFCATTVLFAALLLMRGADTAAIKAENAKLKADLAAGRETAKPTGKKRPEKKAKNATSSAGVTDAARTIAMENAIDLIASRIDDTILKENDACNADIRRDNPRFFKRLALDAQTESAVLDCLHHQKKYLEKLYSLSWVDDDIVGQKVEEYQEVMDSELEQLLGDKYAAYKEYEPHYEYTKAIDGRLGEGSKLSDEQADRLTDIFHKFYDGNESIDWENEMSGERHAANLKEQQRREDQIKQEAGKFLTPEQVKVIFPF